MLDIHWLQTFVTLARLQHFGQTATELHMTQPNVSLHIKRLEQATRVRLIERSPFRLTQAGERLLQSAERTIAELQLCQSDLNALNQLSQGTLAIAASDIISRLLLIQPFQRFKREFPGIDLTLFNTTSDQAAELVKAGKADLGFVMAQKRSEPLFYTELQQVTWCALGHGLARWQARAVAGESDPLDEPTLILLGHDTRTRALIDPSLPLLALPPAASWRWAAWTPSWIGPRRALVSPSCRTSPCIRASTSPRRSPASAIFPGPVWVMWCVRIRCYQGLSSSCCTGWRRRSRSPIPI